MIRTVFTLLALALPLAACADTGDEHCPPGQHVTYMEIHIPYVDDHGQHREHPAQYATCEES